MGRPEATSSSTGLTWSEDKYQYDWKTNRAWSGTCRQLSIVLLDNTVHTAVFNFK